MRAQIGAFAAPDAVQFVPGLPKTRSGKIMRSPTPPLTATRHLFGLCRHGGRGGRAGPAPASAVTAWGRP